MAVAWSPLFAALFFVASNILRFILYIGQINRDFYIESLLKELDPEYLKLEWLYRDSMNSMRASANILNAIAWVLFSIPMIQVAWVLSRGGQRKMRTHGAIVGFTLAGIITELTARLLLFGSNSAAHWVAHTFNLDYWILPAGIYDGPDGIGWRALEVTHIILRGLTTYVDAFEWVCLFAILVLIMHSVDSMQNRVLNIWWARFGLLVAFLCLFDLASAVLLFFDLHTYTRFAVGISIINTLIFLPAWLIILAFTLPGALPQYVPARDREMRASS
mmetsp:Transcript_2941/g.4780  ORF Transcript_2941/g.4780 Transcript_2941/m.4780 type:complete len:275 (-) Transcript_2941:81-905(-)|eukprot:CAMPEP_0119014820 /NCGR_PEP_ID=MMETSP1176-20130426/10406_1 /TAXON_ID=265551 /ORGANISM="Synedropsis recta cf, Strain CCMP1620" /LENGTH=274 /DNA_ID=CAMNT_0006968063 /DNA_START=53 /DNA_END=877 /DNA_ORIENTATION=+